MLQISSYLIVEELTNNEPRHLRARSLSTGDLVSLFLFEQGESTEYQRVLAKMDALTGPAKDKILDRLTDAGRPVIVTKAIPDSETLGEMLLRLSSTARGQQKSAAIPGRIGEAPLSRPVQNPLLDRRPIDVKRPNAEWSRVREKFFHGENPMAQAGPRPLLPVQAGRSARKPEVAAPSPLAQLPVDVRPAMSAQLARYSAPPSDLEIFEAKTLRIELPQVPMIAAGRPFTSRTLPMPNLSATPSASQPRRIDVEPASADSQPVAYPTLFAPLPEPRTPAWLYAVTALGGSATLYALVQLITRH